MSKNLMKTDNHNLAVTVFPQRVAAALSQLKDRLQEHYKEAYPSLGEIIHLVVAEEEAKARELSFFPHLLLPDLVEAHIAQLGLPSADTQQLKASTPRRQNEPATYRPAFALCG